MRANATRGIGDQQTVRSRFALAPCISKGISPEHAFA
jgi:hypothetical protein